eukprot:8852874-Lingulodinium_polyedra.AAC.1
MRHRCGRSRRPRRSGTASRRSRGPRKDDGRAVLHRVDLKMDKRVFALLDEGCNRTCHTPAFYD